MHAVTRIDYGGASRVVTTVLHCRHRAQQIWQAAVCSKRMGYPRPYPVHWNPLIVYNWRLRVGGSRVLCALQPGADQSVLGGQGGVRHHTWRRDYMKPTYLCRRTLIFTQASLWIDSTRLLVGTMLRHRAFAAAGHAQQVSRIPNLAALVAARPCTTVSSPVQQAQQPCRCVRVATRIHLERDALSDDIDYLWLARVVLRRSGAAQQRQQERLVVTRAKKQKEQASSAASSSGDEDLDMVALEVESDAVSTTSKCQRGGGHACYACIRQPAGHTGQRSQCLFSTHNLVVQPVAARRLSCLRMAISFAQSSLHAAISNCGAAAAPIHQRRELPVSVPRACMRHQEDRMKKAINVVVENFNTMRTGRANPAILDKIMVGVRGGDAARCAGQGWGLGEAGLTSAGPKYRLGWLLCSCRGREQQAAK